MCLPVAIEATMVDVARDSDDAQPLGLLIAVADAEPVLTHERWNAVLEGFTGAGALILAFVPSTTSGLKSLLSRANGVVQLCGADVAPIQGAEPLLARLGPLEELDASEAIEAAFEAAPPTDATTVPDVPEVPEVPQEGTSDDDSDHLDHFWHPNERAAALRTLAA